MVDHAQQNIKVDARAWRWSSLLLCCLLFYIIYLIEMLKVRFQLPPACGEVF